MSEAISYLLCYSSEFFLGAFFGGAFVTWLYVKLNNA
jgi:hypothetical protein